MVCVAQKCIWIDLIVRKQGYSDTRRHQVMFAVSDRVWSGNSLHYPVKYLSTFRLSIRLDKRTTNSSPPSLRHCIASTHACGKSIGDFDQ